MIPSGVPLLLASKFLFFLSLPSRLALALRRDAVIILGFDGVLLMTSVVPMALSRITSLLLLLELPPRDGKACLDRVFKPPFCVIVFASVDFIGFNFPPS